MTDIFKDGKYTVHSDDPDLNFTEHLKTYLRITGIEAAQREDVDMRLGKFEEMAANILSESGYPTNLADLCAKLDKERKGSDDWPSELVKLAYDLLVYVKAIKDHIHHKRMDQAVCWTIDLCNKAATIQYLKVHEPAHERANKDQGGRPGKLSKDKWMETFKMYGDESDQKIADRVGQHRTTVSRKRKKFTDK